MARSMTGFGLASEGRGGRNVQVEVRSVNNRYLELNIRLPRSLNAFEQELRDRIRRRIVRGRVSVSVNETWDEAGSPPLKIDIPRARRLAEALGEMARHIGLNDEVRIEHLLAADNLLVSSEDDSSSTHLWELTSVALDRALDGLIEGSSREGEALVDDLRQRMSALDDELARVRSAAARQIGEYRGRLEARLAELLGDSRLDPLRLEAEVALAADRLDVSEEIVRLGSHINQFNRTLALKEPIGKTLNFLLQEMGREVNTIASKSWLTEIAQTCIRMKELVEQIREQVQNLE